MLVNFVFWFGAESSETSVSMYDEEYLGDEIVHMLTKRKTVTYHLNDLGFYPSISNISSVSLYNEQYDSYNDIAFHVHRRTIDIPIRVKDLPENAIVHLVFT